MKLKFNEVGFIFDLDGVIVDTAVLHYKAWRRLANSLGFDFSEVRNEELKGVGRMDSLDKILSWGGITMTQEQKLQAAERKNEWYGELITHLGPKDALPGAINFLEKCADKGIAIALGSASKNAMPVLNSLEITDYFDVIVDGHSTTKNKPDPEVFLKGASGLNLVPSLCAVFEDAAVGIEAACLAGMTAIGIGKKENLPKANQVYCCLAEANMDTILDLIALNHM
ncbi:MAG: beta-phosphoglucomutase [Saprospiraceae bacterium]|jgi:beta-phosphoglucomutase|nr:MAG: beta-phosphoglucomutase [Candidatus Parvibacillus calidus]MBK7741961.1 beta-phosphoglucomutase [Candidatus Parvibacillus calidus]MCC7149497.1 beta-phosphoglucomutase [Saprospiraceae bacterium]WKZ64279.1 MAG: beta-phosphoglucomutase [Saprospiraceae bacterium]